MDKVKITREQQYKLQEWLNDKSKKIAKETNISKKSDLHVQYTAVLKFIENNEGEAIYSAKHSHRVKLEALPEKLNINFNTSEELVGILSFLQSAGIVVEINLGGKANEKNT